MRRPECYAVRVGQVAETFAVAVLFSDAAALIRRERPNRWATDLLSVSSSFPKSRSHPFPDQGALELRDCTEYLEHQLAGRKRCVYRLRRRHEVNPELAEQFERRHQLPQ